MLFIANSFWFLKNQIYKNKPKNSLEELQVMQRVKEIKTY